MKHYRLFLLLIPTVWLGACNSNPLQQDDAKMQIEGYYGNHQEDLVGSVSFEPVIIGKDSGSNNILFRTYIHDGLLQHKEVRVNENADSVYYLEITEKGKPYALKVTVSNNGYPVFIVKTFDYYISEITDIKYMSDKKEAVAMFDMAIRNFTPFGEKAADRNHKRHLLALFKLDNNKKWKLEDVSIDPRLNKLFDL